MNVTIAHLTSPKAGESANGDAVFVRQDDAGRVFLAIIDGLGHGPIAAAASRAAVARLETSSFDVPMIDTIRMVHDDLQRTRGAAATFCVIRGLEMESCAIGNVQLFCLNSTVPLVMSAGVLGHNVRTFRVCACHLKPGTRLALASDGISSRLRLEEFRQLAPASACEAIFKRYRRVEDDASILIADMEG